MPGIPGAKLYRESRNDFSIVRLQKEVCEGRSINTARHLPTLIKEDRTTDGVQIGAGAAVERQAARILGTTDETVKCAAFLHCRQAENV
jgi:hypothetical protein